MRRTGIVVLVLLTTACGSAEREEALHEAEAREAEMRAAAALVEAEQAREASERAEAEALAARAEAEALAARAVEPVPTAETQRIEEVVAPDGTRTLVMHDLPTQQPAAEVRAGGGIELVVDGLRMPDGSAIFHRVGSSTWVAFTLEVPALLEVLTPQLRGRAVGIDVVLPNDPAMPLPVAAPPWAVTVARFYPESDRPAAPAGVPSYEVRPDPTTGRPVRR